MRPLRVAVIGYGKLGSIHARLLNESNEFELTVVVDPIDSNRRAASDALNVKTAIDVMQAISDFDCAVVATPTVFHHQVAEALLQNDKHVFVEKPITATLEEARELVAIADARELILQVGHVVRFDHRFQAARRIIQSPSLVECKRTSGYTFRSMDVGVTLDLMIHDLDLVLALVESPVAAIQATGSPVIGPHEDIAHARLTFENGAMANLTASRASYQQVRSLQASGPFGFVDIDFLEDTITSVGIGESLRQLELDPVNATEEEKQDISRRFFTDLLPRTTLKPEPCNAIAEEHKDFFGSITQHSSPRVCGKTGLAVLETAHQISELIKASNAVGQPVASGPHFNTDGTLVDKQTIYRSGVRGL